jgi:hypothetical protein
MTNRAEPGGDAARSPERRVRGNFQSRGYVAGVQHRRKTCGFDPTGWRRSYPGGATFVRAFIGLPTGLSG